MRFVSVKTAPWLLTPEITLIVYDHARIQKVCQRGSNFDNVFFLVVDRREDPNKYHGPSLARQRNAIKWRFAGVLMMAQQ